MKNLRTLLFLITVVLLVFTGCATTGTPEVEEEAEVKSLTILHTNDHHGHPLKFFQYPAPDLGGLPARATMVQESREAHKNVLVLDAGDVNTGRPESNFFDAWPDFIGYNYIGYDAMAVGNHEFDLNREKMMNQEQISAFPWLSANIKGPDGDNLFEPYIIKEYDGLKVAILGLCTRKTVDIGNPEYIGDLTFQDEVEAANEYMPELQEKADIVIGLVHMGWYDDESEGTGRLAANVDGFDLIIGGHSHDRMEKPEYVNDTPIVMAYQWGLVVGKGVMKVQNGEVRSFDWESVPINLKEEKEVDGEEQFVYTHKEYPEDEELLAKLEPYANQVEEELSKVVGEATGNFSNEMVRKQETALGDMVADSMEWYTQDQDVDFAIQNGGGIRTDLPEGEIEKGTIYEVLPFDNSVMVLTMDGSDVQELFDYIATISRGEGAFPQISESVNFTINYDTGECEDIRINGEPLDTDKTYKIATNSYMAAGGDGYSMFKNAENSYDTSKFQRDVFIEYVQEIGEPISPDVDDRIEIIDSETSLLFDLLRPAA
ncbi:MAG: 5'-nucleotidase C-terminal domain-containing protein [Spirochaetia bacterium]